MEPRPGPRPAAGCPLAAGGRTTAGTRTRRTCPGRCAPSAGAPPTVAAGRAVERAGSGGEQVDRRAVGVVDDGVAHAPEGVPRLEVPLVAGPGQLGPGRVDLGGAVAGEGQGGAVAAGSAGTIRGRTTGSCPRCRRRAAGRRPGASLTGAASGAPAGVPERGGPLGRRERPRVPPRGRPLRPGHRHEDAVRACRELLGAGLTRQPGPPRRGHHRPEQARAVRDAYVDACSGGSRTPGSPRRRVEVSVKLSAVGQALAATARRSPSSTRARSARPRRDAGTTVTLDMEDHTTTDSTLGDPARAARGLPLGPARCCRRTCTAPRPTAADLAVRGLAGAAVQGRVQGAGVGRVPGRAGRRPLVRPLPARC